MNRSRILVVDDEPNLSGLVRVILEQTNRFEVRVENRSALALAAAREFHPDMILLDVDMPGKNGGEVARQIKAEPAFFSVPILFLTSLVSRSEAGESQIVLGGMHYLAKPVSPKALVNAVDGALAGNLDPS